MITVGSRVAWLPESRKKPVIGTVRAIKHGEARVDDGDPANDDVYTNGWRISAWVPLADLTEIS